MHKLKIQYINIKSLLIFLVVLILLGVTYNFLKPKEKIIASLDIFESKQMLSYVKDNKLYFINSKGKSILLYDKAFENSKESEDDKKSEIIKALSSSIKYYYKEPYLVFTQKDTGIYFLGDIKAESISGTLYRYDEDKGIKKIDEQVKAPIYVSPDCNKMAYSKLNGKNISEQTLSDLYIYETGKPNIKVLENCSKQVDYKFSWSTNSVAYTEYDLVNNTNKIYIKKQFKDKELVDEGFGMHPTYYSDDGDIISYMKASGTAEAFDYYTKKLGEKPEHLVASNYFKLIPASFSAYYIGDYDASKKSGNLYYKELNKAPIKIAAEIKNIFLEDYNYNVKSIKQGRIFFQKKNEIVFMVNEKKAPQKVAILHDNENIISDGVSTDFLIIPKGKGKIKKEVYNKSTKSYSIMDIDENATILTQSNAFESNKLFYIKRNINNYNEFWSLDLSSNAKELIQTVSKNEGQLGTTTFLEINELENLVSTQVIGSTLYYSFNNGIKIEIYVKKAGSKPIKIAESNGNYLAYDEDTLYYWEATGDLNDLVNEKYKLYVYRYGKGSELVTSEISMPYIPY